MTGSGSTTAAALLERAAVLIATHGLHKGYELVGADGSLCPDGAICAAALEAAGKEPTAAAIGRYFYSPVGYSIVGSTIERTRHTAQGALCEYLDELLDTGSYAQTWAAAPERRAADVVDALRAAALIATTPGRNLRDAVLLALAGTASPRGQEGLPQPQARQAGREARGPPMRREALAVVRLPVRGVPSVAHRPQGRSPP